MIERGNGNPSGGSSGPIPYRIRFGVTGHRSLPADPRLAEAVAEILSRRFLEAFTPQARDSFAKASATPLAFTVVSPLAEGADRLVARLALVKGALLEALLPMPRQEYQKDFATPESLEEFSQLIALSHRVSETDSGLSPGEPGYRVKSYRMVGEEMVSRCDILIALWDGKEPRSECGTGAIVRWATERGNPVFVLSTSAPGTVELRNGATLEAPLLKELEQFNRAPVDPENLQAYRENEFACLFPAGLAESLPPGAKELVRDRLIPPYCRASLVAKENQRRYLATGKRGYLFSTLSVAFMAAGIVFAHWAEFSLLGYLTELTLLILLYFMIHRAVHDRVHQRWLEHRVLAERLRNAFYFAACGLAPSPLPGEKTVHRYGRSWVDLAYAEVIYALPRPLELSDLRGCARYIRQAWLKGQLDYHDKKKESASQRNSTLKKWGLNCFLLAIVISVIHHLFAIYAIWKHHHLEGVPLLIEQVLSVVAITLPAAGAAANGYRSLLEQSRLAARSAGMVYHLERLLGQKDPSTAAELRQYLERIEDLMLMESQDWHKFMEHSELDSIA